MIRVAAVGDIHLGEDSGMQLRPAFDDIDQHADILLLAGDLTRTGTAAEAMTVAGEFAELPVPVVAVLGNHDYHADHAAELTTTLRNHGITVLDGDSTRVDISGSSVGIAGIKGFGGGFAGRCGSSFGEPEMKAFVGHTMSQANRLACALRELDTDLRIALLHYAPIPETLGGEPLEIYPFWALTYSGRLSTKPAPISFYTGTPTPAPRRDAHLAVWLYAMWRSRYCVRPMRYTRCPAPRNTPRWPQACRWGVSREGGSR